MTVDEISGGRVTFGVGAGWTRREHEAYGWELYDPKTRVDRFEEALEIWELLQTKERVTYFGKHYELIDAPFEPKSSQGKLPVLIGGTRPRMMRLVARFADIWDRVVDLEEAATASANLDKACAEIGRDPASIVHSVSPRRDLSRIAGEVRRTFPCLSGAWLHRFPDSLAAKSGAESGLRSGGGRRPAATVASDVGRGPEAGEARGSQQSAR